MRHHAPLFAALAALLLAACSAQQAQGVGQAMQLNQCNRIDDAQERGRCLDRANKPRDAY